MSSCIAVLYLTVFGLPGARSADGWRAATLAAAAARSAASVGGSSADVTDVTGVSDEPAALAVRGGSPVAFDRRGIPPRRVGLGATRHVHHELPAQAAATIDDPDELYAGREDLSKARRAQEIWTARLAADASDYEAAWKAARARYWLGNHGPAEGRRRDLEAGVEEARRAAALRPDRPEGQFWLGANMGALAESFGLRQGLKYRRPIKDALERVLEIDPSYLGGAADRALGRWYFKVPGLFGGSNEKSVEHLRKALTYNPNSTVTRYFLAETLLDMGRKDEARAELQRVLDAPFDPDWAPEDRDWKARARALLVKTR
jgi:tetratricopeptide (TPR) repeat protein